MGLFSTRNNDGASGKAESANTIPTKDYRALQERARGANPDKAALFSDESARWRRVHRPDKAGTN